MDSSMATKALLTQGFLMQRGDQCEHAGRSAAGSQSNAEIFYQGQAAIAACPDEVSRMKP